MISSVGKIKNRRGMTMAEVLIVVAIIVILAGVSFIAVMNYLRSMAQLERDGIAKEIFVAAQNNLTAAKGEGYLGNDGFGTPEEEKSDIYYYVVNEGTVSGGGEKVFPLMLPFASIDETVRTGGSYLIRYQKSSGLVLDVFYTTIHGSHARFNHTLATTEYDALMAVTGNKHKSDRRTYTDRSVIGWYGGTEADELLTITITPPEIEVMNAERLYVNIKHTNTDPGVKLRLIITGVTSGVSHYLNIQNTDDPVILDDITAAGTHFRELTFDDMGIAVTDNGFIPGEDIVIKALAYSNEALSNVAYSAEAVTNSLFGSIADANGDGVPDTAGISNIRHLENLDKAVSGLGAHAAEGVMVSKLEVKAAVQTDDLSWTQFTEAIRDATGSDSVKIMKCGETTGTKDGCFYPLSPDYALSYDGQSHSISDIKVDYSGSAGLFGELTEAGSSVKNLELIDFNVTGTVSAGALAGKISGTEVTNVLARNSEKKTVPVITASAGDAGGHIGLMTGTSDSAAAIKYSAAALTVNGKNSAGGLIGTASGNVSATGCYSAGVTDKGEYYQHAEDGERGDAIFSVTSSNGTAGGLIGSAGNTAITASYSSASVSGNTAGGLAGSASGVLTDCYCTGLVSGEGDNAFIGNGSPALEGDNYYYSIINETVKKDAAGNVTAITYKGPGADGVKALDEDAEKYNAFSYTNTSWEYASAYDSELVKYYSGKYNFETVYRLLDNDNELSDNYYVRKHYGDWPAPEVIFENTLK